MAHDNQRQYCESIRQKFPDSFKNKRVLDIGSLDINGCNRPLFEACEYIGLDIGKGKNVDIVCPAHRYEEPSASFDTIISTECFEHDMHLPKTLDNIIRLLKPGGLFLFTCATTGRHEHGTIIYSPGDSPFTSIDPIWSDYYKNVTEEMVRDIFIDVNRIFKEYEFNVSDTDLRFYGIRL